MKKNEIGEGLLRNPWYSVVDASSGDIRRLASVWRYSSIPIVIPENVADHTFWVALYSAMIHTELQRLSSSAQKKKYGKQSVFLAIMLNAITHDMAEAVTGDIVRPFKYSSAALKREVDIAEKNMMGMRLPTSVKEISWIAEATANKANASSYVEAVVKAADFLSLYQFMRREVLRGNTEIRDFVRMMVEDFRKKHISKNTSYPHNLLNPYYRCLEVSAKKLLEMTSNTRGAVV